MQFSTGEHTKSGYRDGFDHMSNQQNHGGFRESRGLTVAALVCALLVWFAAAGQSDPTPVLNPANGHYYEEVAVAAGITWADARNAAASRVFMGVRGHLITIASAGEDQFASTAFPTAVANQWFLGGFQPDGSPEPSGGWTWATGEPWAYTNWNSGEPNNSNNEGSLNFWPNGRWNDSAHLANHGGYVVEYEPNTPVPNGAPRGLSAAAVAFDRVELAWTDGSTNETGFEIERRGASGVFRHIALVGANVRAYADLGVIQNTTYGYRVRAINGGGDSAYSNEVDAVTPSDPALRISFLPPVTYALTGTQELDADDFDGDGKIDLAVAVLNDVAVLYGLGNGAFEAPAYLGMGVSGTGQMVGVDVNGDGAKDMVFVAGPWGGNKVYVLRRTAARSYAPPVIYTVGTRPFHVVAHDFNGDDKPDLAVTNHESHSLGVLLNNGDGTFGSHTTFGGGNYPGRLAVGDFNDDSHADLAMTNIVGGNVRIYLSNGGGGFNDAGAVGVGSYPTDLLAHDFTGDGILDLAVANDFDHTLSLLTGNGSGTFGGQRVFRANTYPLGMKGADFELDGDLDIATSDAGTDYFSVFVNVGGGTLRTPRSFTSGGRDCRTITTGYFNGDDLVDVAIGNSTDASVSVFINNAVPILVAPTNLTATAVSNTKINLVWTHTSGSEHGFNIERKIGSGSFVPLVTVGPNVTTYSNAFLSPNTQYTYRVRAFRGTARSDWAVSGPVTTLPLPADPTDLTATAVSSTRINLAWVDNATDENGYKIEKKTGSGGSFGQIATVGAGGTSYPNIFLTPNTEYTYRVRAYRGTDHSGYATSSPVTTPALPGAPTNLTATAASSTRINLSWTDNAVDENGFLIERRRSGTGFFRVHKVGPNVTTWANAFLQPNTEYTYRVRAYRGPDHSAYATSTPVTTLALPAAPTNVTAAAASRTRVVVTWTDVATDEAGYKIEKKTGSGVFVHIVTVGANVSSYTNHFLTPNTQYTYRVRAYRGADHSAYATSNRVTTPP